jgi:predicted PurR-regulated permease PerM
MSFPPPTPNQARVLWFSLTALGVAVLLGLGLGLIWGLGAVLRALSPVLLPVALALVLAYVLDPVVGFLAHKKIPRAWAIALVFALCLAVAGGVVGSVVPGLLEETRALINELPKSPEELRRGIRNFLDRTTLGRHLVSWQISSLLAPRAGTNAPGAAPTPGGQSTTPPTNEPALSQGQTNAAALPSTNAPAGANTGAPQPSDEYLSETVMLRLTDVLKLAVKWVSAQMGNVTTWAEFVIGFVLAPVCLFYFLLEKDDIRRHWTDYLPIHESKAKEEVVFILRAINDCMIVFFRGQVLVAACVGVLLTLGYLMMGLHYAVLLGLVAAVLGIVPYLGTIITLTLALTVAAVQFGDWVHPLLVLGIAIGVKILEDFVISPKILGDRAGLHPLTIIIAVMVGTTVLGGVLGALLAIPLTAALRTLMYRYVWKDRASDTPASAAGGTPGTAGS